MNCSRGLSGKVTRGKKAVLVHGDAITELVHSEPHRNEELMVCAVGIPIKTRGRVVGALTLASVFERSLSSHEVGFLEAVASQIGLACDNARMIQQIKNREKFIRKEHDEVLTIMNELGAMVYVADMQTYEMLAANKPISRDLRQGHRGEDMLRSAADWPGHSMRVLHERHLVKDGKTRRSVRAGSSRTRTRADGSSASTVQSSGPTADSFGWR